MNDDCGNPEIEKKPVEPTLFEVLPAGLESAKQSNTVSKKLDESNFSGSGQATPDAATGINGDSSKPIDLPKKSKLVAFGGFVKPNIYDIFGDFNLDDVTESEKEWMTASNLFRLLLVNTREYRFAVDEVPLNAFEYNLIARSPSHLARFATANVLNDNDLDDEKISASKRAPVHVLGQKIEGMQHHVDKLNEQNTLLESLRREIGMPGYAHKTKEEMRQLIAVAWNELAIIMDVLRLQRGWDDKKHQRAKSTLLYYLTQGSQRERVSHWRAITFVANQYLNKRIKVFETKITQSQEELKKYPPLPPIE